VSEKNQVIIHEDGPMCTVTINRPEKRNSLSSGVLQVLSRTLDELDARAEIRVIILRGAGDKAFCAGFDITEIPVGNGDRIGSGEHRLLEDTFRRVRSVKQPVIAMINGICVGAGLDLAINCDFRIAREGVLLGMTPAKLGVTYHPAGLNRFLQLVGINATKELFYTGKLVSTSRALETGLLNRVVSAEELEETVYALAAEIARNAPLSLASLKYTINKLAEKVFLTHEEEETIRQMTLRAFNSRDLAEGQRAFTEKRKPRFTGR